ncbi:MAG: hypothetical protein WD231_03730 [Candidatus Woykebacteria bacterium]
MLSTPHILVGAAIVKVIPNPAISLPLAFLSHLLFDAIPHWDFSPTLAPKTLFKIFLDYALGMLLVFLLTLGSENQILILLGGVAATVPDFILASFRLFNLQFLNFWPLSVFNKFHLDIQNRVSPLWGGLVSFVTVLICAFILLK